MRNISKLFGLTVALTLLFASCEKWIDPEINIDPDVPLQATPDVMLPGVEASLAYYIGGFDIAGTPAIWMQQILGQDRQASAINSYTYRANDPNNLWSSMYSGVMMDLKKMIEVCSAAETKSPVLGGISKLLLAVSLGQITDLWGDIPYSEAFLGASDSPVFKPKLDSQQSIYTEIMLLLQQAITDLQDASSPKYKASGDYIYGGSASSWLKAAYHMRARYEMHLQKVKTVNYASVISDLSNGFTGLADDMELAFEISAAGQNPLYQYLTQRSGYVGDNAFFVSLFQDTVYATHDPRDGYYSWSKKGFWLQKDAPVAVAQYTEALFLMAEASYMNSDEAGAITALKSAIDASLEKYDANLSDPANLQWVVDIKADIDTKTGTDLLEMIMVEKYKHMFCQMESWNDWRRTGYPQLTPTQGTQIPRRYPYPQSERDYNGDNVKTVQIFNRIWWDAE